MIASALRMWEPAIVLPVSRSIALVLGSFLAVNAAARLLWPGLDATIWLLDLRAWPTWPGTTLIATVAAAMLSFTRLHGVLGSAIAMDAEGLITRATIRNASRLASQHGLTSMLAVNHFYHLPASSWPPIE